MSELSRGVKYWKNKVFETTALILAVTVGLSVIIGLGIPVAEYGSQLAGLVGQLPYIFNLTGGFALLIMINGMYQGQFSIILSLNCRRKALLLGMIGFAAAMMAVMMLFSFIIWGIIPATRSAAGLATMPLFLGMLLVQFGISMLCGCASIKWGTMGTIITVVIVAAFGGVYGYSAASVVNDTFDGIGEIIWRLSFTTSGMLPAGVVMTAVGIAASVLTIRRMEVKV